MPDNNYLPFLQAASLWFWESLYSFSLILSAFSAFLMLLIQLLVELWGGLVMIFFFNPVSWINFCLVFSLNILLKN